MCVRAQSDREGAIFEAHNSGKTTGIILQRHCTTSLVGGCLKAHSGIHPFIWKPRPCLSYQSDHPVSSDRGCQAAAGHSQPAAACRDTATYRCCLCTKHPQQVLSLSPRGEHIYSFCTDRNIRWCPNTAEHVGADDLTF